MLIVWDFGSWEISSFNANSERDRDETAARESGFDCQTVHSSLIDCWLFDYVGFATLFWICHWGCKDVSFGVCLCVYVFLCEFLPVRKCMYTFRCMYVRMWYSTYVYECICVCVCVFVPWLAKDVISPTFICTRQHVCVCKESESSAPSQSCLCMWPCLDWGDEWSAFCRTVFREFMHAICVLEIRLMAIKKVCGLHTHMQIMWH